MLSNNAQIQAQRPDVGCAGGFPRSLPPRAARPAGVICGHAPCGNGGLFLWGWVGNRNEVFYFQKLGNNI